MLVDQLVGYLDNRTAADVWYRMRAGERGVLGRHIYTYEGQATFDEVSSRYDRDSEFRNTVDRYIGDFERLLAEAEQSDPAGHMLQNYLTSETGRVYLLLAHASGRGPAGVFWALAIAETMLAVLAIVLFRRGRWKKTQICG